MINNNDKQTLNMGGSPELKQHQEHRLGLKNSTLRPEEDNSLDGFSNT